MRVAATKTHFEKQTLVAGAKQRLEPNNADRKTWQSGLPNLYQACLLGFVPATSAIIMLKWMFHKLICSEQSTSLKYVWSNVIHSI